MVFVVWCNKGSKKWYPLETGDNPSWPLKESKNEKYWLELCAVDITAERKVTWKEDIEDGTNVKVSLGMVKLSKIKTLEFKIMC